RACLLEALAQQRDLFFEVCYGEVDGLELGLELLELPLCTLDLLVEFLEGEQGLTLIFHSLGFGWRCLSTGRSQECAIAPARLESDVRILAQALELLPDFHARSHGGLLLVLVTGAQ